MTRGRARGALLALAAVAGGAALVSSSHAQRIEGGHGLTVLVGPPRGRSVAAGVDAQRSNASPTPLPTGSLRVAWTRQFRTPPEPPVVELDGAIVVVGDHGDTVVLNPDGTDRHHLQLGPGPMGAPALLTDGTVVVVNGDGEVLGVRSDVVVFRTRAVEPVLLGGNAFAGDPARIRLPRVRPRVPTPPPRESMPTPPSVLPLADGGFAVAADRALVSFDADGGVRTRMPSPVAVGSPLVALRDAAAFVSEGQVFAWDLRGNVTRTPASFEGSVVLSLAALDERRLVAVVDGSRVVAVDVVNGEASVRATSPGGGFTGALAVARGVVYVQEATVSGTRVVAIATDGALTTLQPLLTTRGTLPALDGGASLPVRTALLADPSGSLAYGTTDGHLGVTTPGAKVELGFLPCGVPAPSPHGGASAAAFTALVPAGPKAFVVACEGGTVSLVRGD